jgi:hypothetical protein
MSVLRSLIVCFVSVVVFNSNLLAHTPVDFLEVLAVQPARKVEHAVELKSKFDSEKVETQLEGPQLFSRSVGCLDRAVKKQPAYLNWYKIVDPKKEPIRTVAVLDMIRGTANRSLKIHAAEYFLSPSQLITTGAPEPIPGGLDQYKAYRVIDAPPIRKDVNLTNSVGPAERKLGKPLFVCLPVKEWHHDDYFAASHPNDCFVVYELDEESHVQTFGTIDQFGLNELESVETQWLCVRAAWLRSPKKQ